MAKGGLSAFSGKTNFLRGQGAATSDASVACSAEPAMNLSEKYNSLSPGINRIYCNIFARNSQ